MATQTPAIKALLKDLLAGKKLLKAEFEKSIRAIDEAISVLNTVKLHTNDVLNVKTAMPGPGRPKKEDFTLKEVIKNVKGKGKRGRPVGTSASLKGNLTQMLNDMVVGKNKFVHSRDIVSGMLKKFPGEDRADFGKKISVLLASLKKQGRLVTYKDGGYRKNMYWGSPAWLSKEGRIVKGRSF
jgi:hypothetical protein